MGSGSDARRPRSDHGGRSRHPDHPSHDAEPGDGPMLAQRPPRRNSESPLLRLAMEDLKGPLAAIRLHLSQLDPERHLPHEKLVKAYRTIERNISRLDVLLDDTVDLSKLEHGVLALERDVIDLAVLVRHLLAAFEPFMVDAGITVESDLDAAPVVEADEHRVAQAVASILHAAIQSTPRGGFVRVRTRMSDTHGCVEVIDSGRGMTMEQIRNIGDLDALDRRPGLGLHFARIMVGLHSGDLAVQSEGIGHGTHVRACFPMPVARTSAPGSTAKQ